MIQDIFWECVDSSGGPDACWPWKRAINQVTGYGALRVNGVKRDAHRYALSLKLGRPVKLGMLACHTCHNRKCCNPNHLYEGTYKNNYDDAVQRGTMIMDRRYRRGDSVPSAVLTNEKVAEIVCRLEGGDAISSIAKDFGVARTTISNIKHGYKWGSVTGISKKNPTRA